MFLAAPVRVADLDEDIDAAVQFYLSREDSHFCGDATEKVLILRKVAQDKVYLYVLRYYILYAKTVFQWRPIGGEKKQAGISGGSQSLS